MQSFDWEARNFFAILNLYPWNKKQDYILMNLDTLRYKFNQIVFLNYMKSSYKDLVMFTTSLF